MQICPKCNRKSMYISSDGVHANCHQGCGYFAHFQNQFFFLGIDESFRYCIRDNGTIRTLKRVEQGDVITTEERRLVDLENKFKEFVNQIKISREEKSKASDWWFALSDPDKVKVYKLYLSNQ